MPYVTLGEMLARLDDPQKSEAFLRMFHAHVRERRVTAANLPTRFELPQRYVTKTGEPRIRTRRDMVIDSNAEFERWFKQANEDLNAGLVPPRRPKRKNGQ